jgi:hypothetical protein
MLRCAVAVFVTGSIAFSAAADSAGGLAAPGDCAQPSAGFESPATYEQAAIVGGSAADHFAPRVVNDVVGVLPLDLTRTRTVSDAATGVGGTIDRTGDALDSIATDAGAGDVFTGVENTVDLLTGTTTRTTDGLLGGRK